MLEEEKTFQSNKNISKLAINKSEKIRNFNRQDIIINKTVNYLINIKLNRTLTCVLSYDQT